jgi:hypothetical protein
MIKLMKIIGITLLLNFVILLVGMPNSNASDYNSILKGEYVFTGSYSCAWGGFGNGFNPDLSRDANGYENSANIQGVLTFNGDGTGSLIYTALAIRHLYYKEDNSPVMQASALGTLLYNVNEDKTFTVDIEITDSTPLIGPYAGATVTISGIEWDGWIVQGNQILSIYNTRPNIHIVTLETEEPQEEICGTNITAFRKKVIE